MNQSTTPTGANFAAEYAGNKAWEINQEFNSIYKKVFWAIFTLLVLIPLGFMTLNILADPIISGSIIAATLVIITPVYIATVGAPQAQALAATIDKAGDALVGNDLKSRKLLLTFVNLSAFIFLFEGVVAATMQFYTPVHFIMMMVFAPFFFMMGPALGLRVSFAKYVICGIGAALFITFLVGIRLSVPLSASEFPWDEEQEVASVTTVTEEPATFAQPTQVASAVDYSKCGDWAEPKAISLVGSEPIRLSATCPLTMHSIVPIDRSAQNTNMVFRTLEPGVRASNFYTLDSSYNGQAPVGTHGLRLLPKTAAFMGREEVILYMVPKGLSPEAEAQAEAEVRTAAQAQGLI